MNVYQRIRRINGLLQPAKPDLLFLMIVISCPDPHIVAVECNFSESLFPQMTETRSCVLQIQHRVIHVRIHVLNYYYYYYYSVGVYSHTHTHMVWVTLDEYGG